MSDASSHLRVKVPHECFVPTPKHEIVETLLAQVSEGSERQMFADFCRLIEGIYHFEYHRTANELKQDFRLFNSVNGGGACETPDVEQLCRAEERFLLNFRLLMDKGNFRPLTQEDIEIADAEDYLFTLPVQTDWSKLDCEMLSRFLEKHPDVQAGEPPEFAHRILIYQRGVGLDRTRGFLTIPKIDLLISNLLLGIWRVAYAVGSLVTRLTGLQKPNLPKEEADQTASHTASDAVVCPAADKSPISAAPPRLEGNGASQHEDALRRAEQLLEENLPAGATSISPPSGAAASAGAPPCPAPLTGDSIARAPATNHQPRCMHEERYIERMTLQSTGVTPLSLFRRTEIQEPTFKELVVLFRFAPSGPRGQPPKKDWAIHIKAFRDIPMADLEVVFPEKKISMKPLDLVKLVITGAMGVAVFFAKLIFSTLPPLLAGAAFVSVVGYAAKVFFGYKSSKDRYHYLVTDSLYHKNLDNNLGVIFYLMDSLEEQEFKEAVLGYFVLWRQGEMTQDELDCRCEHWLKEQWGDEVNFEVEDALDKLVRDDLVLRRGDRYATRPLAEALERLDGKWDDFFRYHRA